MKALLKAFIKPFKVPQRSVKINISVNFFPSSGLGAGRVKKEIQYYQGMAQNSSDF